MTTTAGAEKKVGLSLCTATHAWRDASPSQHQNMTVVVREGITDSIQEMKATLL